jgi:RNA polymerase sigma-70 factor (ECF subfamily)
MALLALMLLHDSRRGARTGESDELVLLEHQDRTKWNRAQIKEGLALIETALRGGAGRSRYGLEASIAGVHASAAGYEDTDWEEIAALYLLLSRVAPSPVVDLNHAVAVSMVNGPEAGLRMIAELEESGELRHYHLLPAAQAWLWKKLGRLELASEAYGRAASLARNDVERQFLEHQRGLSMSSSAR